MVLPNFLVIGAQKCGTTWIYDNLRRHPEVFMPQTVELNHFNRTDCLSPRRMAIYARHFTGAERFKRIGEKTPSYFWTYNQDLAVAVPPPIRNRCIPESVKTALGEGTDLIVSFRHPVHRAISAYHHHARKKRIRNNFSFLEYVHLFGILEIGYYARHLQNWLDVFPIERFEFLVFENDIVQNPDVGFGKLCRFLGVDESFLPTDLVSASNAARTRRIFGPNGQIEVGIDGVAPIRPDDITFLLEKYAFDMEKLSGMIGDPLLSWKRESRQLEAIARQPSSGLSRWIRQQVI